MLFRVKSFLVVSWAVATLFLPFVARAQLSPSRVSAHLIQSYTSGSSNIIAGHPRVLKILDNSSDYSIQNTARQALFLPTSREAKYKAKAAIDAFFMRFGDVLQAGKRSFVRIRVR